MQYSFPPILKNDDFVRDFVEKFAEYDAICFATDCRR